MKCGKFGTKLKWMAALCAVCATGQLQAAYLDLNQAQAVSPQMVSSGSAPNQFPLFPHALDGVASLTLNRSDGNFGCSATLLSGGQYLLTAGHCVTNGSGQNVINDISVSFLGGSVKATVSSASQVFINPDWDGHTFGSGGDLALLKLDTKIKGIKGYDLVNSDSLGKTVLMAGYGETGSGATGYIAGTQGVLHYGLNTYDTTWDGGVGKSLAFDFDDGTAAHDTFCIVSSVCNKGLGRAEAMISPGDSGGGSFVFDGKHLLLAGVHSFGASFGSALGDIDGVLNGSFGEAGGDTSVYAYAGWVRSVPEPQTYALMMAGLVAVGIVTRRRKAAA